MKLIPEAARIESALTDLLNAIDDARDAVEAEKAVAFLNQLEAKVEALHDEFFKEVTK